MATHLTVYLSGEIHTDWRDQIVKACAKSDLPVEFVGPELDHATSDNIGQQILGEESQPFWKDHKAAKINAVRNRTNMELCDVVVVRFGDKYRQWNAAFDAGLAIAEGKSLITLHDENLDHALKEIDAAALVTARSNEQVVEVLKYVLKS